VIELFVSSEYSACAVQLTSVAIVDPSAAS
jgi:hypothetical protein